MTKNILVFSDGTGQVGGVRPDQQLSNVYKIYRATRPGPDSPIDPKEQVAFYDPGLGTGETDGWTWKRFKNTLAAGVGTGIDENVIDCYAAIISFYEPGDRVVLIGFSRGAYTVRSVANVMNVCGVPTRMPDGEPVPRHGPRLRKIATDAVKFVYNHGAGHPRGKYEEEREAKAARFRARYGSEGSGMDGEPQGNVQPHFIGVFDTVAALNSRLVASIVFLLLGVLAVCLGLSVWLGPWWLSALFAVPVAIAAVLLGRIWSGQYKYFFEDPERRPRFWNPFDWPDLITRGHFAWWKEGDYDRFLDNLVPHARDAMSIDENRAKFPRVGWGSSVDQKRNAGRDPEWFVQMWFPGNHSDVGGSYPEPESRLSDAALEWMVGELRACVPDLRIRENMLHVFPDAAGLQHDEVQKARDRTPRWFWKWFVWSEEPREVRPQSRLHPSVLARMAAGPVPIMGRVEHYRPEALRGHEAAGRYFGKEIRPGMTRNS